MVMRSSDGTGWGEAELVASDAGAQYDWSPDGSALAVEADDAIGLLSLEDGRLETLVENPDPKQPSHFGYPLFSPDGRSVLFRASGEDGVQGIWSVPISGGRPARIVEFDDPGRRSERRDFDFDGERFYFAITQRESGVWVGEVSWR
jgi:Tol biopolymer transport system component